MTTTELEKITIYLDKCRAGGVVYINPDIKIEGPFASSVDVEGPLLKEGQSGFMFNKRLWVHVEGVNGVVVPHTPDCLLSGHDLPLVMFLKFIEDATKLSEAIQANSEGFLVENQAEGWSYIVHHKSDKFIPIP